MEPSAPVDPLRFRRAPLLAAAVAFACGHLLTRDVQFPLILTLATLALVAITLIALRKSPQLAPLPVLALWLVVGCWCTQIEPAPSQQSALHPFADGLSRTIEGRITRIHPLPATPTLTEAVPVQPWQLEPGAWDSEAPDAATPTAVAIDLAVTHIEALTPDTSTMQPIGGGVRLTLTGDIPLLHCGDLLTAPVRLRQPERYRDPGAWSYADFLLAQNISATAPLKSARIASLTPAAPTLHCRVIAAQTWAVDRLHRLAASPLNRSLPLPARITEDDAAMLSAMLFGDRSALTQTTRRGFERTGSFHLFVVSGMHVALLAGMVFFALTRLRTPRTAATLLTIAATCAYAALTGFGTPVTRALLMTTVFLLARWLGRDTTSLQALGVAALAVLVHDPRALTDASFQMTFLVIVAVAGIASPLAERILRRRIYATRNLSDIWRDAQMHPRQAQLRVLLRMFARAIRATPLRILANIPTLTLRLLFRLAELFLIALIAEACMALPMALYFHRATPFALPANIVALPMVALLVPLAVITFVTSLVSMTAATIPAALTALALHAVNAVINTLSHLHRADIRIPAPPPLAVAAALALIVAAVFAVRDRRRSVRLAGLLAAMLIPVLALFPAAPQLHTGRLEVTAIDVGQGDSLLVVSPAGHTLLIDAGGPTGQAASPENASAAQTRWDVGEEVVAPFLWSRRLRTLDAVALTHAHSDHMGGLPAILRDFHPRELWLSIDPGNAPDLRALLRLCADLGIFVRHMQAGNTFDLDQALAHSDAPTLAPATILTVLAPDPAYTNPAAPRNDDSLVLRLDYGQASALLEGDAERPSEDAMLAAARIAPVTLLKVGHHGSRTSTNPAFLAAARPREAVISSGAHNTFGHPRPEILQRLEAAHTRTWRTDRAGATTFLLTPDGHITAAPTTGAATQP